jgi:hypothetical protein
MKRKVKPKFVLRVYRVEKLTFKLLGTYEVYGSILYSSKAIEEAVVLQNPSLVKLIGKHRIATEIIQWN